MKKVFNKLVRDKIPEIIAQNGEIPEVEILDDAAYPQKLREKLLEECREFLDAKNPQDQTEEIADILEVLRALADSQGISMDEIETIRLEKLEKRGAFKQKLLLKSTAPKL